MPTSSSTVNIAVAGLTEFEAGVLLSRIRHMQTTGVLSKEISIERSNIKPSKEGLPSYPIHEFTGL